MKVYEILNEGLIKLPTKMHEKLLKELRTVCVSYMRAKLNATLISANASPQVKKEALNQFNIFWKKKYPQVTHRKMGLDPDTLHVKDVGVIKKNEMPANYSKLFKRDLPFAFEFDPSKSIKAQFKFDFKELSKEEAYAMYMRDGKNIIDIDLKKVKVMNWMVFVEEVEKFLDGESRQAILDRLQERIHDVILDLEGIAEHELSHAVQWLVLSRGSVNQIDGDIAGSKAEKRPTAGYSTSQLEFDPIIRGLTKGFIKWVNRISRAENRQIDWKILLKYFVGAFSEKEMLDKLKLKPSTEYVDQSAFFVNLKQHDKTKWQKGVKLFTIGVEDLIK